MGDFTNLGKKAEAKIKEWLNRPEEGYCFDRLVDQMNGFRGSCNISDFTLFRSPNFYYIESKATREDRFPYSMITDYQRQGMIEKSKIDHVHSYVIVLFASYQRAFLLDINDIQKEIDAGRKSINIKKIDSWQIPYIEIRTLFNTRKELLDYDKNQQIF